jgi:hypothetical protein
MIFFRHSTSKLLMNCQKLETKNSIRRLSRKTAKTHYAILELNTKAEQARKPIFIWVKIIVRLK